MKITKRILSLILALSVILGTLAFTVSCGDVQIVIGGGSSVQPDSSTSGDSGNGDSDLPIFIENGNQETDYSELKPVSRGILSTVRIVAHFERYIGYGQTSLSKFKKESSGVIYQLNRETGDAYIITNFHAVYHKDAISTNRISPNIDVYLYGQEDEAYAISATYVGGSLTSEIAVLKVSSSEVLKHSHALAAGVADSNSISIMDEVFAVGNPEGLGLSVTGGNISVEHDELSVLAADGKTTLKLRVIRTTAPINEGNSGGGLYNADGELCGIVVAKKTGDDIDNIAYAIPSNLATLIADILIENYTGSVTVGFNKYQLGVTMESAAMTVKVNDEGELVCEELVSISEIKEGSVLSGKAELGDIITSISINGTAYSVTRIHNVVEAMLGARLGSTVSLTLLRGDKTVTVTVTVSEAMETLVV